VLAGHDARLKASGCGATSCALDARGRLRLVREIRWMLDCEARAPASCGHEDVPCRRRWQRTRLPKTSPKSTLDLPHEAVDHDRGATFTIVMVTTAPTCEPSTRVAQHWHAASPGARTPTNGCAEMGMHFAVSSEQFVVVIVLTLQMMRELSAITFRATRSI
jgi:hypothetical protein